MLVQAQNEFLGNLIGWQHQIKVAKLFTTTVVSIKTPRFIILIKRRERICIHSRKEICVFSMRHCSL